MTARKNRPAVITRLLGVCVVGVIVLAQGTNAVRLSQVKSHIKVDEPRPLAAAILTLEAQTRTPITYEDPPYQFAGDLEGRPDGPLIPRPGRIDFEYSDEKPRRGEIIRSLVEAYTRAGNPGVFEVKEAEGFFHVVPRQHKNQSGDMVTRGSILDTPVSVSAQNITGVDILGLICNELSEKLNERVVVGMIPLKSFAAPQEAYTVAGRPARVALAELLRKTGGDLSWQLLYDPKLKWYVLNIHPVGYSGPSRQERSP